MWFHARLITHMHDRVLSARYCERHASIHAEFIPAHVGAVLDG